MAFGRHDITNELQEIELNDAEIKDLENDGPKHWFVFIEVKAEPAKKVAKKASKKVSKKVK